MKIKLIRKKNNNNNINHENNIMEIEKKLLIKTKKQN